MRDASNLESTWHLYLLAMFPGFFKFLFSRSADSVCKLFRNVFMSTK